MTEQRMNQCQPMLMLVGMLYVVTMFVAGFVRAEARSTHEAFNAHCVDVIGTDTIEVWTEDEKVEQVRLIGVDSRFVSEQFPLYVHALIRERIDGKMARIEVYDRPSEGQIVGRVIVDHHDLSFVLISEGLVRYNGEAPAVLRLYLAEEAARENGRGMWSAKKVERQQSSDDLKRTALSDAAWKLDYRRRHEPESVLTEQSDDVIKDDVIKIDIGTWIGEQGSLLMANWGVPDEVEHNESGGEVLVYDRCRDSLMNSDLACEVCFFVDDNGIIFDRQWR